MQPISLTEVGLFSAIFTSAGLVIVRLCIGHWQRHWWQWIIAGTSAGPILIVLIMLLMLYSGWPWPKVVAQ